MPAIRSPYPARCWLRRLLDEDAALLAVYVDVPSATSRIGAASYRQSYDHCDGRRAMALIDTQQTMDAYIRDLLNRGDYSRHYSDDVVVEVRGTDQRYRGREAVACQGHGTTGLP